MNNSQGKLTRIGVFYDGNYFLHVSNYYKYSHPRKARISISGLHHFIRQEVAKAESTDPRYCQIVDAHYFRGRLNADEAKQRDQLYRDRQFDDILIREGVVAHHLPLSQGGEKGIDVWLALEAFELAIHKRFDVSVLVAGDGDFLPLVRKLNTIGTRVMLAGWDFKFTDDKNVDRVTRISQSLLDEVTYPLMMHQEIDDRSRKDDPLVNGLFMPQKDLLRAPLARDVVIADSLKKLPSKAGSHKDDTRAPLPRAAPIVAPVVTPVAAPIAAPIVVPGSSGGKTIKGTVISLKDGYGFVKPDGGQTSLFFHHSDVIDDVFDDLKVDDRLQFAVGANEKGACAVTVAVAS